MPEIKFLHVVSCSSEDKNYPANNLLKMEGGSHKWKSAAVGEKQVSVILQCEKSSAIHSIDIGNESSAFVEVFVGKSTQTEADYKVILVASSFMNPLESRNGTNTGRVRMFGKDSLSQAVLEEKWDRIKIVCTQPFNKNVQYGVSFIRVKSPPNKEEIFKADAKLGPFKLKATDSPERLSAGSIFARKKETKDETSLKGAAAVRAASKLADSSLGVTPIKKERKSPHAESKSSPIQSKVTPNKSIDKKHIKPVEVKSSNTISHKSKHNSDSQKRSTSTYDTPLAKKHKVSKQKEFSKLLSRVVFSLSGFKNPNRGELRDRALAMGAKYQSDWSSDCTHLICAFPNTPKYNTVLKGKGKIVKENWIKDCYDRKEKLPWRKYRLGEARSPPGTNSESENEEVVSTNTSPNKSPFTSTRQKPSTSTPDVHDIPEKLHPTTTRQEQSENGSDDYNVSTDADSPDTDDEIIAAQRENEVGNSSKKKNIKSSVKFNTDGYPILPDYFENQHFLLYGKFPDEERRLLFRLIIAFGGEVENYMGEDVNYVITHQDWDTKFDEALSDNPTLTFVKPTWILICDSKNKLVPHQPYIIVPQK